MLKFSANAFVEPELRQTITHSKVTTRVDWNIDPLRRVVFEYGFEFPYILEQWIGDLECWEIIEAYETKAEAERSTRSILVDPDPRKMIAFIEPEYITIGASADHGPIDILDQGEY